MFGAEAASSEHHETRCAHDAEHLRDKSSRVAGRVPRVDPAVAVALGARCVGSGRGGFGSMGVNATDVHEADNAGGQVMCGRVTDANGRTPGSSGTPGGTSRQVR